MASNATERFPLGRPVTDEQRAAATLHRSAALDWALLIAPGA